MSSTLRSRASSFVRHRGRAVVFTSTIPTHTPSTGAVTTTTSTQSAYAMRLRDDPVKYQALNIVKQHPMTFLVTPGDGRDVALSATFVWDSESYRVVETDPIAPDGTVITTRVVVAR